MASTRDRSSRTASAGESRPPLPFLSSRLLDRSTAVAASTSAACELKVACELKRAAVSGRPISTRSGTLSGAVAKRCPPRIRCSAVGTARGTYQGFRARTTRRGRAICGSLRRRSISFVTTRKGWAQSPPAASTPAQGSPAQAAHTADLPSIATTSPRISQRKSWLSTTRFRSSTQSSTAARWA